MHVGSTFTQNVDVIGFNVLKNVDRIYGKGQIVKVTARTKKCHRINIEGASTPYEKIKENWNPKPSVCGHLKFVIVDGAQ